MSETSYYRDKVAIVTGGASGIGRALSQELGRRGALVVVADINKDGAERTANSITTSGGKAWAMHLDVTKKEEVTRCIHDVHSKHGRLDFIFNNAGIICVGDARDMDIEQFLRVLEVNLLGVVYGTMEAYHLMTRQGFGHIVNIASGAGLIPIPLQLPYVTSKFGVVGLSQTLRLEGANLGVNVTVVCPGFVQTEMFDTAEVLKVPREKTVAMVPQRLRVSVDSAVKKILSGVERNRAMIVFPFSVRLLWFIYKFFPALVVPLASMMLRDFRMLRKKS